MQYKKIAIISDIHAQLDALDVFINYLEQEEIQLVFNLGDFISGGPNPCEVFDKIIRDKRFINIKGYDEEKLFNTEKSKEGIGEGEWLIHKLGPERLRLLKEIPSIKTITINHKRFLLCHHNGWSDLAQLEAHTKRLKDKKFEYIAYGGSHVQELSHAREPFYHTNIIDPGTLGLGKGSRGYLAIIEFEKQEVIIRFQSLEIQQQQKSERNLVENKIVQEESLQEETFLYITGQKKNSTGRMYINDEVVERIIDIGIQQCKYVSIGCWKQEKQVIRELLYYLKCRRIKASENEEQEWYIGEITPEVSELLLNKRNSIEGKLKWLEISFQNSLESISPIYSIYHYGKECFLKKLTLKELYTMEDMLKKYDLNYSFTET